MYRIVVPLDGSKLSEQAIRSGQALARALRAPIELVHILEEPVMLDLMPSLVLPDRAGAEKYLERLAGEIAPDITVETPCVAAPPTSCCVTRPRRLARSS
jgi:nucleotide-binding universal stress UspA family protein